MDRLDRTHLSSSSGESREASGDETIDATTIRPDVPGYQILRELGRGAMGVVYEAVQLSVGRHVALKTLDGFPDSQKRDRFRAEAEAVAQLQHAHIVQLYDFGEVDGLPYFSLELVTGGSLESAMESETVEPRRATEWIETLARAMQVAHDRSIVHRDLKPANVLITESGQLKISDFGLAKRTDNDSSKSQAGDIVGTPHYMAPEQAIGDPDKIGPATDVYALGAILYDLLTGTPPFSGVTILETLERIRVQDPTSLRRKNPKVHADLDTICLKCLQKERRYRYGSALDLAEDLRRFLDGEPVLARPIGPAERLVRRVRRNPVVSALVALGIVGVVIAAFALSGQKRRVNVERERAAQAQQQVEAGAVESFAERALALEVPLGLKAISVPSNNPLTYAKVELGRMLFFDKRLSVDDSVSCATCHNPALGWSDAQPVATGIGGQKGRRNTPSIVNTAHQRLFFWDGRAEDFEEQALGPLLNPIEMGNPSAEFLEKKVADIGFLVMHFESVFDDGVTAVNISRALASFQRTIMAGNTPYDRFRAGDETALPPPAKRGMDLFFGKANCSACHSGPYFADGGFHNIGLPTGELGEDAGREAVTGMLGDRGAFKTPTLREVSRTAPYMHDGSLDSLETVIEHYDRGGSGHPQQDEEITPLGLTNEEKRDLVTFLKVGLASPEYPIFDKDGERIGQ